MSSVFLVRCAGKEMLRALRAEEEREDREWQRMAEEDQAAWQRRPIETALEKKKNKKGEHKEREKKKG